MTRKKDKSATVACSNITPPATIKTARKTGHLFKPGNNANPTGRPKGSRNKFSENYIDAMLSAFEQHGACAIEAVVLESPAEFLRLCSAIVPKTFGIDAEVKLDGAEAFLKVWEAISEGRA